MKAAMVLLPLAISGPQFSAGQVSDCKSINAKLLT